MQWADNVKISGSTISLPTSFIGPRGSGGVSFLAVYYSSNERVIIEAIIDEQFNFNNYGQYQLTLYYPNSRTTIGTWTIHLEPKDKICMPKQFVIRDSLNSIISNATVKLIERGQIAFTETSNRNGIVNLPRNLPENCYDVEIDTHQTRYKTARFRRIVFQNKGPQSITYFIYRQMQNDEIEFLLTWGKRPSDLDSHMFVSDGRHVYFSKKQERNVSLDYDCREGGGPETIKVKLEPNMKYVYAVHKYTEDGELARSDATVTISTNEMLGVDDPLKVVRVPYVNRPQASFWIVCQIDGTTRRIKFFDREFENQVDCNTDAFIRKYFDV